MRNIQHVWKQIFTFIWLSTVATKITIIFFPSPEEVANCMLLALSEGGPGSIFISENGENYEIEIPPYSQMRKVKAE